VIWRVRRVHGKYWPILSGPNGDAAAGMPSRLERLKGDLARWKAYFTS
jgi:hypothetical protein